VRVRSKRLPVVDGVAHLGRTAVLDLLERHRGCPTNRKSTPENVATTEGKLRSSPAAETVPPPRLRDAAPTALWLRSGEPAARALRRPSTELGGIVSTRTSSRTVAGKPRRLKPKCQKPARSSASSMSSPEMSNTSAWPSGSTESSLIGASSVTRRDGARRRRLRLAARHDRRAAEADPAAQESLIAGSARACAW
jgi:hypothetical protein